MATDHDTSDVADSPPAQRLEGQTYEIIRNRLAQHGADLRDRLSALNVERKTVFGSVETALLSTERVSTDNNCTPRDMVAIGERLLLGYNVHVGLRSHVTLNDVFSEYLYHDHTCQTQPLELVNHQQFEADFAELYKYYKNTTFARFATRGPYMFMVFRVGKAVDDIKTFKWMRAGDRLEYVDNRSDYEFRYPPQHEFQWRRTTRDQHRSGMHPHVSIEDLVFVETLGGDLTLKVENNTDTGAGIYTEPVADPDQTLDDAEIHYAILGNLILLKIRPYHEQDYRYIIYNAKLQQARRVDAIADACVLLPDDHGVIFPQGYYLQTGESKTFDTAVTDMMYEKQIRSPNGEDILYIFFNRLEGVYVLLSYNLISQEVSTPNICSGSAFFDNGEVLTFRHHGEPLRHHAIQIWQTPFTGPDYAPHADKESALAKIGNRDLVRGMSECQEVLSLLGKDDTYGDLYLDISRRATDIIDSYFWITDPTTGNLAEPLAGIRDTAQAAISEFEKVVRQRDNTRHEMERVAGETRDAVSRIEREKFNDIHTYVASLTQLRRLRGEVISLRELKYVDPSRVDELETAVSGHTDKLSQRCVDFLMRDDALVPYQQRVAGQVNSLPQLAKVAEVKTHEEEVAAIAIELEMLIEIVSNLKIDDATQRTTIIDNISAIFAQLNQTRAQLKSKKNELMSVEGAAEFASQLKLLNQAVVNYLDVCDTPQKCEEYLTKLMIQVEELEARFSEFDEMIEQLIEKREEIYNAFEARKLQLVEARNRRANSLMKSAERILGGIRTRVDALDSVSEINGYFAGDLMVDKLRDIIGQLEELDDSVKVGDVQSQLKTIREDAVRQLKDRQELYVDGQNVLQLGRHKFSVNIQALDLTTVLRDDQMCFHLTGTNFFEPISNEEFLATRPVWTQEIISENDSVYRAEYLAYQILQQSLTAARERGGAETQVPPLAELSALDQPSVCELVQKYMAPLYAEGYVKGVHDQDATRILHELVQLTASIGFLRYRPAARALAWLFWTLWDDQQRKPVLSARLTGFGRITALFPATTRQAECVAELQQRIAEFVAEKPFDATLASEAGEYLFFALAGSESFAISGDARQLREDLQGHLESRAHGEAFAQSLEGVRANALNAYLLARDWVTAFLHATDADADARSLTDEVAQLLIDDEVAEGRVVHATTVRELTGLVGSHPRVAGGNCRLSYHEFMARLNDFVNDDVPRFVTYTRLKHTLLEQHREEMRLSEFRPRVLTSFVRNRLIDQVYLPLVGDNLAKQLGTAGDTTRTDRMGLLLLISPPGYGKTTLMEYVANRLGLIFMKINGPAIGHRVTSLDASEAPNAAAREEVEKLNLALEMGDNVMIYLDDIQHVNPELLQKFISLCDATRKIEGVYQGRTRTYDLRGKRVCVVMAGNPYTESGERFQIPDMLANRADTYNLGEIIGDNANWFELSYLENALTSNPTLARLASRNPHDVLPIIQMAESGSQDEVDLEGNYSLDELNEFVSTIKKLFVVRDIVLRVNREYIRSAGQADEYRTEPSFKLQGSYRNMNRIAERVSPLMNDDELRSLIVSQYEQDAQTLTSGTEANLLKFKLLMDILTAEESKRWEEITQTFARHVKLASFGGDDKMALIVAQMDEFSSGLAAIRTAVDGGVEQLRVAAEAVDRPPGDSTAQQLAAAVDQLSRFGAGLESIRETVSQGMQRVSDRPDQLTATFAPETAELLTRFVSELQMSAAQGKPHGEPAPAGTSPAPPIKVQVVNKVPRLFLSIIREQFRLMQQWMEPLTDVTKQNQDELHDIQQQLDEAMKNYDAMIEKLEETE